MKEIQGKYTSAKIFTDNIEPYAVAQIQQLIDNPVLAGSRVRIMPDAHPGKLGPIGFTATVSDKIMPGIVGFDIGCGVTLAKIKARDLEFQKLDTVIRDCVPSGYKIAKNPHRFSDQLDFSRLLCAYHINQDKAVHSLGTLGGGNHFIELDKDDSGNLYVAIHSGSRHLGKEVAEYYIESGWRELAKAGMKVTYILSWLEDDLMKSYINDVAFVREYAELNRKAILDSLCKGMKWKVTEYYSCVHNYIETDTEEPVIRKGAISAKAGEKVVIPINMRDGIIVGKGKGNLDWNESAPHGSGRILTRCEAEANADDVPKIYGGNI